MNNIIEIKIDSEVGKDIRAFTKRFLFNAIAKGMNNQQAQMSYSNKSNIGFVNIYTGPPQLTIKVIGEDKELTEKDGTLYNTHGYPVFDYNDEPQITEEAIREELIKIKEQ